MCELLFKRYKHLPFDVVLELEEQVIDRTSLHSLRSSCTAAFESVTAGLYVQLFDFIAFNLPSPTTKEAACYRELLRVLEGKYFNFLHLSDGYISQHALAGGLHDHLRMILTNVGGMDEWPTYYAKLLFQPSLNYNERFQLVIFLLHNGCPPTIVEQFFFLRISGSRDHQSHASSTVKTWLCDDVWCARTRTWCIYHQRFDTLLNHLL